MGIAENVGNAMTFKILMAEGKIIHRSVVRSTASNGAFTNKRADTMAEETIILKGPHTPDPTIPKEDLVLSKRDQAVEAGYALPDITIPSMVGRTFTNNPGENGEQVRAKIHEVEPLGTKTPCPRLHVTKGI